jgi:transcription elongation factor GreB
MAETNYITRPGYQKLLRELEQLGNVERPRVVQEVADAAAQGDRSENAEYIYGKRRLREIDKRMRFLSQRLEHVQVVEVTQDQRDRVFFGAYVEIEDDAGKKRTYHIVGEDEVEPREGRISWKSPLGRAVMKKQAGDPVVFDRPDGSVTELVLVRFWY